MAGNDAGKAGKEAARARLVAATARYEEIPTIRQELHEAIVEALREGMRPTEVAALSPYTEARVRGIRADAGLPPARKGH